MTRSVKAFCNDCIPCQRVKLSNSPRQPMEEFDISGIGPGDLIAMDIATLPWSDENYRYFLCIMDVFTRYIEAIPLKDQKACSIVKEFENGLNLHFIVITLRIRQPSSLPIYSARVGNLYLPLMPGLLLTRRVLHKHTNNTSSDW